VLTSAALNAEVETRLGPPGTTLFSKNEAGNVDQIPPAPGSVSLAD
jgi:hypothetical protein